MFTEKEIMTFNDLEMSVYKFILNNKNKIPYMTIRELASETHVSTTTIIRMCKKLSCKGFSEFKIRYRIEMEGVQDDYLTDDKTIFIEFLKRASDQGFVDQMDKISELLNKAQNIIFLGYGNSGTMAQYAAKYFSSVGKLALHLDTPMYPVTIENPENTIVVVLSVEGRGRGVVQRITDLKENKVPIVSITNSSDSMIAKLSDYNLSYYVLHELKKVGEKNPEKIDITTQLPVVYIIETLAKKTYNMKYNNRV